MENLYKAVISTSSSLMGMLEPFESQYLEQCLKCIESDANSPPRGDGIFSTSPDEVLKEIGETNIRLDIEKLKSNSERFLSIFDKIREGVEESFTSIKENEVLTKNKADESFWEELKDFAREYGVVIGFTRVPRNLIFKGKKILYPNAIVLAMEMRKPEINKAPEQEAGVESIRVYAELGEAANKIAKFLRSHGFKAQASHPLGGLVLYPLLAAKAGLGFPGRHGLLITPQFGPRQRLAAVFNDIKNMPYTGNQEHKWILDFCSNCSLCVKECPSGAILENPLINENGTQTTIDQKKCFPYFATNFGCSVCIKVCPFNRIEQSKIKEIYKNKKGKISQLIKLK